MNQVIATPEVWKGSKGQVNVGFKHDLFVTVPKGMATRMKPVLEYHDPLLAPIQEGNRVATLKMMVDGRSMVDLPVVALESVQQRQPVRTGLGFDPVVDEMSFNMTERIPLPGCSTENLIDYPSDFPIKIMGAMHDDFAATIVEVIVSHDPDFHAGKITMRASAKGNYLGLTATVRATSREQLDNIYRALSSHPMVKIVI